MAWWHDTSSVELPNCVIWDLQLCTIWPEVSLPVFPTVYWHHVKGQNAVSFCASYSVKGWSQVVCALLFHTEGCIFCFAISDCLLSTFLHVIKPLWCGRFRHVPQPLCGPGVSAARHLWTPGHSSRTTHKGRYCSLLLFFFEGACGRCAASLCIMCVASLGLPFGFDMLRFKGFLLKSGRGAERGCF